MSNSGRNRDCVTPATAFHRVAIDLHHHLPGPLIRDLRRHIGKKLPLMAKFSSPPFMALAKWLRKPNFPWDSKVVLSAGGSAN